MVEIHQIIRSRRKTIALVVQRDGLLVVRAPLRTPEITLRNLVAEKESWIRARQAEIQALASNAPRFVDGEKFQYLGELYPLRIVPHRRPPLVFEDAFLLSRVALTRAEATFASWYKARAAELFPARVAELAEKHGFHPAKIRITSARTRWGSCSSRGTLSFTWRLVMAPQSVIDYVIVHELAHLQIKNHSRDFWNLVGQLMPDYQAKRLWLKNHGRELDI